MGRELNSNFGHGAWT